MRTKKASLQFCTGCNSENETTAAGTCLNCGRGLKPTPAVSHTPTPWKVSQTGKFVMHSRPGTVLNVCEACAIDCKEEAPHA